MRNDIIDLLYRGTTTIQEFQWDMLTTVPILQLMTMADIAYIRRLITSPRYSGNSKLRLSKIDEIMHYRGFVKFAGGTNRVVYTHPQAPNTVFKVAIDIVGINDNPAEYKNQQYLKPYCCKVFECSPCGTIASFEQVNRITTIEEFASIADDYFYLLSRIIIGKYVMEDIGVKYFMNVGIRKGFGVVILDFPYLFVLDGAKLKCSTLLPGNVMCGGEIDYDVGFNKLICTKCKTEYRARDVSKTPQSGRILVLKKGSAPMRATLIINGQVVKSINSGRECTSLPTPPPVQQPVQNPIAAAVLSGFNVGNIDFSNPTTQSLLQMAQQYSPQPVQQATTTPTQPTHTQKRENDNRRFPKSSKYVVGEASRPHEQCIIFTDSLPTDEVAVIGQIYCIKKVDNLYTQKVVNLEVASLKGLDLDMFDAFIRRKDEWQQYHRDPKTGYLTTVKFEPTPTEPEVSVTEEPETPTEEVSPVASEEEELEQLRQMAKVPTIEDSI